MAIHNYSARIEWTGNRGEGTSSYKAYERSHIVTIDGKPDIFASSDSAFRGDKSRHNPEDLFLSALSSCHMLWYLHLCAEAGIIVTDYIDNARGIMDENIHGRGKFVEVILNPIVTVGSESMIEKAKSLHEKASEKCFIANSCNFPVHHQASIIVKQ